MGSIECIHTIETLSQDSRPTWRAWLRTGLRLLEFEAVAAAETISVWRERTSQRRALMALDDHGLKDIGLSRSDAWAEYEKPFWR